MGVKIMMDLIGKIKKCHNRKNIFPIPGFIYTGSSEENDAKFCHQCAPDKLEQNSTVKPWVKLNFSVVQL